MVATTFANALAGVYVAYSSAGTGTQTLYEAITNSQEGEYAHVLLRSQLPDPLTGTAIVNNVTSSGATPVIGSGTSYGAGVVSNQGGNNPFNVTQPGVFVNMYMKL